MKSLQYIPRQRLLDQTGDLSYGGFLARRSSRLEQSDPGGHTGIYWVGIIDQSTLYISIAMTRSFVIIKRTNRRGRDAEAVWLS